MKIIALKGEKRKQTGSKVAKKIRQEGKVPCVFYGNGQNVHFDVFLNDFNTLVYSPETYIVQLDLNEEQYICKLQDIQFHPVSEVILHADFLHLDPKKSITLELPVQTVGVAPGVREGGKLQTRQKKVTAKGKLQDFPNYIEINIDGMEIGDNVRVKNIASGKLELLDSPENPIISCVKTRASISEDASSPEGDNGEAPAVQAEETN
ncbi:MAG: 50S ribosomal protein L25 [Bacteroidetes bacterium MED-G17]|nr:MAG: 50S ribosomal protein L25 [Bacteroidetes bacterium MED-G17]